jgi:S-disulfanyl-L-cysteine oxidoreductase SoxD
MSRFISVLVLLAALPALAQQKYPGIGRNATAAEITAWDIDVRPDFKGLPGGSGSVAKGQEVWEAKCASCHGTFGESNEFFAPIVGGTTAEDAKAGRVKSLVTGDTARTTLMKLSTISTLWDYINRAMPWNAPKTLTTQEVYAVTAYILNLADIVRDDFVLSNENVAQVQQRLPNRNGMTREHGLWDVRGKPDVRNAACMKDCNTDVKLASVLPEAVRDAHGNLREQNRPVGPVRGTPALGGPSGEQVATVKVANVADLAKRKACLTCHTLDKRLVGPAFREIAVKYRADASAEARLAERIRRGGSGTWGTIEMPPNPDLPEADVRSLVQWILGSAK